MPTTESQLDRSLVRGIAWTGGMKWLTQIASWAVTLVVARILTPADFGLLGMATVYMGLARLTSEAGLSSAIIQAPELSEDHAAQLGGVAALLGVAFCALSLLLAGAVAGFFRQEQVRWIVAVLSGMFVTRGVQVLPRALLARELRFARLAWIDGADAVTASAATLAYALLGFGYWALALGPLTGTLASLVLCVAWRPHRLALPRDFRSVSGSVRFSGEVLVSQLAWYAYSNADFTVVGRVLGSAALGAYTLGWTIASVPIDRVSSLVGQVVPPIFSAVQTDRRALARYLARLTEGLGLITLPACVGLALVAGPFVRVVLGPTWLAAVVPLRLLALYAAVRSVATLTPQLMVYAGHAKRSMQFSILAALVLPGAFYYATRWGTTGVALGWVTVYPLLLLALWVRSALRISGLGWRGYAAALGRPAAATAVMAGAVAALGALLPHAASPAFRLATLSATGAVVYGALSVTWYGRRLRSIVALLRGRPEAGTPAARPAPAFATGNAAPRDRLLLVSWHFPPDAVVGALRWRKLARYAAERGWGLDVITVEQGGCREDPATLGDLPAGVRIYRVPSVPSLPERTIDAAWSALHWRNGRGAATAGAPEAGERPESLARGELLRPPTPRDVARAYFAWVQHLRGDRWAHDAARVALAIVTPGMHRAVVSCGPPHCAHEAARRVASQTGLPLVMDLRDPWRFVQRLPEAEASPVWYALARRDERRAVERAALVVANTEPARDVMRRAYPERARRIIAVPNGCDDDEVPRCARGSRFVVAYAGTVYLDRDPRPLFRAAAAVTSTLGLTPADFGIELMGAVASYNGVPIEALAREAGVAGFVRVHPPRPRAAALEFLARAQLLAVLPQDSDLAIPAKIFEYMQFDAWLLVLATRDSASARLLEGSGADVVDPADADGIGAVLARRYREYRRGVRARQLAADPRFSRAARAAELFDAIEAVAGAPKRVPALPPAEVICAAS